MGTDPPGVNFFRGAAIFLTQLPMMLYVGAKFDLLFGFNQTHAGFATLLILIVSVPLLNLSWLIAEIVLSIKQSKQRSGSLSILMLLIALFFLLESIAIDLFLVSQMRM